MYSNIYDDVTNFEVCEFTKNTRTQISWERNIFSINIKGCNMAKKSFVKKVTFNRFFSKLKFP